MTEPTQPANDDDLDTQLDQVVESMAMLQRASEAGSRASRALRDLPDQINLTVGENGIDSHIEVVLREADPRVVAHGSIAGCGDCLIGVRYVATAADGTETMRLTSFEDPDFTPMYAWWAEASDRRERAERAKDRAGRRPDDPARRAEERRRAQKWARKLLGEFPQVDRERTPAAIAELAAWWMRYAEPEEGENATPGGDFADDVLSGIDGMDDDLAADVKPAIADWFDKYSK